MSGLNWVLEKLPVWRKKQETKILSGENSLLLFISSVMNDELSNAREEVKNYVQNISGLVPWAFEFTPASSEDVEEGYLRKVRESDFVIWLVGSTITKPVENEIREALSSNKRLLVFILASRDQRDESVESLISEVGKRAKWSEINENNSLIDALEASITDELIRAVRGKSGLGRIARFNEILSASRARCIARWQAAGISLQKAQELYKDSSLGMPPSDLIAAISEKRVIVLTGSFGSGKSLMAERVLQEYIKTSIKDSSASIPVYIKADVEIDDISKEVIKLSEGMGSPKIQGALVVIDGIDEVGISFSTKILEQARVLARTWQNTFVIITSRPMPVFSEIEDNFRIGLLDNDEIIKLVSLINETTIHPNQIISLPISVREAIKRPFFTILWARYILQNNQGRIRTTGELINYFIEDVIPFSDENVLGAINLLEKLGARSIDNGGSYIPWREIGDIDEINQLLETRLVEKVNGKIGFPLPILTQWFAANGLINNKVSIFELCQNLSRLDKWRYPLIIIISLFPYEEVSRLLIPIVEANPGLASEIIDKGITPFGLDNVFLNYSTEECGFMIRNIYSTFVRGIGELAVYVVPISEEGILRTLGIHTTDNIITTSWYEGDEELEDLIILPSGSFRTILNQNGWNRVSSRKIGSQPAWPWRWCLEEISNKLKDLISRKTLVVMNGHMHKEKLWEYALQAMRLGNLYDRPILIVELEAKVNEYIQRVGDQAHTQWHELSLYIESLRENGEEYLHPLWPCSDVELNRGGWIWEPYSDKRVLERAIAVYSAALEEYEKIINWLFPKLKSRMLIATLLPVKMHGYIEFTKSPFSGRSPVMGWYFEPITEGMPNQINFSLESSKGKIIDVHDLLLLNQKMRPCSREWISAFTSDGALDIFDSSPVTDIVYKWLENDLQMIKMVTHGL